MCRLYHIFGVIAVLAIFGLQSSEGCSCAPSHPQDDYCNNAFVILAVPTKRNEDGEFQVFYDIKIITVFKANPEAKTALQSNKIYTSSSSAACGVDLELNKIYVLMGGTFNNRAIISLCGYTRLWKDVSIFQKQAIESIYKKGCKCTIIACSVPENCVKGKTNCVYDTQKSGSCYSDYGACTSNSKGECNWVSYPALTSCLKAPK